MLLHIELIACIVLVLIKFNLSAETPFEKFTIPEESKVGTTVGVISVIRCKSYFLSDVYFSINETGGQVIVFARIDRDADTKLCSNTGNSNNDCVRTLQVICDATVLQIDVTVLDVNDNAPEWSPPPDAVRIRENVKFPFSLALPMATDLDQGQNSVVRYELKPNVKGFVLENKRQKDGKVSPMLVINQSIDYESEQGYNFTFLAIDGGSLHGQTQLKMEVVDVNDNRPIFQSDSYTAELAEGVARGFKVLTVLAKDADSSINAIVTYSISHEQLSALKFAFNVDATSGVVYVNDSSQIDYEVQQDFQFSVLARDRGDIPEEAQTEVKIKILDINDHKPSIEILNKQPLFENQPAKTLVCYLKVNDLDAGDGGRINCSIDLVTDFELQLMSTNAIKSTYMYKLVTAHANFDRERTDTYNIAVTCQDQGEPRLSNVSRIDVRVEDMNDESPTFYINPGEILLKFIIEEERSGIVASVQAVDRDEGENSRLSYKMNWNERILGTNPFSINDRGQLSVDVGKRLDREQYIDRQNHQQTPIIFEVIALDHGVPSRNASVQISIIISDINDNSPEFNLSTYLFQVTEDAGMGSYVGQIRATDIDDSAHNGKVIYEIVESVPFKIHSDGLIWIKNVLDRELIDNYQFQVLAVDQPIDQLQRKTATTIVRITVNDVNDNDPYFLYPNSTDDFTQKVSVSYREPPDYIITHIRAYDPDLANNRKLSYAIVSGDLVKRFHLDADNGALKVRKEMNRDEIGEILLGLEVRDHGTPSRYNRKELKVVIDESIPLGRLDRAGQLDIEMNKIIIIAIVITTGVICAILITAICVMARRQPCILPFSGSSPNHVLVHTSSPTKCKTAVEKSYALPLTERAYDPRLGPSKFDTFLHPPKNAKLVLDHITETNSESDGDSGKGGSVNLRGFSEFGCQPSPLVGCDTSLMSHNSVRLSAAAPLPYHVPGGTLGRNRPAMCGRDFAFHSNFGDAATLFSNNSQNSGIYHTLYRSKTPSVIYEHQTTSDSSLV